LTKLETHSKISTRVLWIKSTTTQVQAPQRLVQSKSSRLKLKNL